MTNRFAAHYFSDGLRAAHHFSDSIRAGLTSFDVEEYSRMKFGSDRVAKIFGYQLADAFFKTHQGLLTEQCVVIPAPSTVVPVAATLLARHFMNRLNETIIAIEDERLNPVSWSMVHRNISYNHDYHFLNKEERASILEADEIFFNWDYLDGKVLLFIDDVRITGAHEEKLNRFLTQRAFIGSQVGEMLEYPAGWKFVTFAEYVGDDAKIESVLNYSKIKNAEDVARLSHEPLYQVTTRAIRLLLEDETQDFKQILPLIARHQLEPFYFAAISKGYHAQYPENFTRLANFLRLTKRVLEIA